ncbi:MAG: hypothetical protein HY392_05595, partial [Candidatus Diapherotrites archaeon]|nr:hypothetical protein [Candidatus Diapherotrites archaeon]
GSTQKFYVIHPVTGQIPYFVIEIFELNGEKIILESQNGIVEYPVNEQGTIAFRAYQQSFSKDGFFTARPKTLPLIPIDTQIIEELLGEEITVNPGYFVILALATVAIVIAGFTVMHRFSEENRKKSKTD